MEKSVIELYETITRISSYDEKTKTYYITNEDYYILGLNNETIRNKIKKVCKEIGVNLEYQNKPLPKIEKTMLFTEYNNIKSTLETTLSLSEKEILEQKRIHLRNLIVQHNMELIKTIINRRLKNLELKIINKNYDVEDLYQIGYEILIKYIDNHYLDENKLKYYIVQLLIIKIKRVLEEQIGISIYMSTKLLKLREKLEHKNYSIKELSILLDIDENNVEDLININSIISGSFYYELEEQYNEENLLDNLTALKYRNEQFLKIIKTLPTVEQQKTIILLFGLNRNEIYDQNEVSDMISRIPSTVRFLKDKAITQLGYPIRYKYLKQIFGFELSSFEKNNVLLISTSDEKSSLKKLEQFLLKQLDKNIIESLTENLNSRLKESLFSYLGYVEKSSRFYSNSSQYHTEIEQSLNYIRNKITEIYVAGSKNEEITNYLDFLMYQYLNKRSSEKNIKTLIRKY